MAFPFLNLPTQERACILRTVYSIRREEGGDCLFESLAFAWIVGEMALFGRRGDSLKIVDRLSVLVNDPDLQVRLEAVHALGKIGGEVATSALIEVLAAPATFAEMKAKALHASKWWSRSDRASFIKRIDPIVKTYTARLRREIMQQPGLSAGPLVFEHCSGGRYALSIDTHARFWQLQMDYLGQIFRSRTTIKFCIHIQCVEGRSSCTDESAEIYCGRR